MLDPLLPPILVAASDVQLNLPGIAFAFVAGLLSFLSPCVLPLVPSYVAFITGATTIAIGPDDDIAIAVDRRRPMLLGTCFVLGFSTVFIVLGATASAIGDSLRFNDARIAAMGGLLLILLGVLLLGVVRFPLAQRDVRLIGRLSASNRIGYPAAFLVGAAFGAGWTPCIGPVLAAILTLAATSGTLGQGIALLAAYSAGLAVPFLLATLALDHFVVASAWFRRWLPWVNRISGTMLIILGVLLITGTMARLTSMLARYTPGWIGWVG